MKKKLFKIGVVSLALVMTSSAFAASVPWGYEGEEGPEFWGDLSPEYALCKTGKEQSPIDFISGTERTRKLDELKTDYESDALNVQNNGHTIQINMAPGSTIKTPTGKYQLLQFHFHYMSEHTIDGAHTALEAHFVHMNSDGQLAVLGVLIEPDHSGKENEALATILHNAPHEIATNNLSVELDIEDILPSEEVESFWHYNGSLTTPPCSEGVKWYVAQKHIYASEEQIEEMAALVHHHNYRPTQALNGRKVKSAKHDD